MDHNASIDKASGTRDDHKAEFVTVLPSWNQSTRHDKFHTPTPIIDSKYQRNCESHLMLQVRTFKGKLIWLDSHWFVEYADRSVHQDAD